MDVDALLNTTLKTLGYPVERLKYGGKARTFITYQLVVLMDTFYSDDENAAEEYTYRVDLYSLDDHIPTLKRIKQAVKAAGFYGVTVDVELFEENTGYYHIPIEMKYMEV